jgi:hypothetical protein
MMQEPQERRQNMLRVALIVDSKFSTKYIHQLAEWGRLQDNLEISHLIIQNVNHLKQNIVKKSLLSLKTKGLVNFLQQISFTVIKKIESAALLRSKAHKDHFSRRNLSDSIGASVLVTPTVSKSGFVFHYAADDIEKIRALDLDVLIRCGSGILRGDILNCARFGIISFHFGDNRINRGGPPGFWEVFLKQDSTGFTIQQLTEELDGGKVLYRGHFSTKLYFLLNQAALYKKSNVYLQKILSDLARTRMLPEPLPSFPYFNPLYRRPGLIVQAQYIAGVSAKIAAKMLDRYVFAKKIRWGVAFSRGPWKNCVLWRGVRIKNPPDHFLADPFVVSYGNDSYCFVEDYDYTKSRAGISAYRLNDNAAERLGQVLAEPFHLSFPFVFEFQSKFYMCPETAQNRDIRLYECENFPMKWKLKKIIMSDVSAADTIIFKKNDIWWLFTNIDPADADDHCSELFIYYSDDPIEGKWTGHPKNPIFVDSMKGRNGGLLFDAEETYRVSQQQGLDVYGKSFSISRITALSTTDYSEELLVKIEPNFFEKLIGAHHMSSDGAFTAYDFKQKTKINF